MSGLLDNIWLRVDSGDIRSRILAAPIDIYLSSPDCQIVLILNFKLGLQTNSAQGGSCF